MNPTKLILIMLDYLQGLDVKAEPADRSTSAECITDVDVCLLQCALVMHFHCALSIACATLFKWMAGAWTRQAACCTCVHVAFLFNHKQSAQAAAVMCQLGLLVQASTGQAKQIRALLSKQLLIVLTD